MESRWNWNKCNKSTQKGILNGWKCQNCNKKIESLTLLECRNLNINVLDDIFDRFDSESPEE